MRSAAAIPAVALLGGSSIGVLLPEIPHVFAFALMIGGALGAAVAWRRGYGVLVVWSVVVGFAAGAALLASDAWRRAEGVSLRRIFGEQERTQRAEALAEHRTVPEEGSAFLTLEGALGSDASDGPSGVSLDLAVDRVWTPGVGGWEAATGGVLVTVVGTLARERMREWRAGRRVRLPVELRRPSRYLNEGVPDAERALRRRGVTLVGSAKSGALVDMVAAGGWFDERAAALRAYARRAIGAAVGAWSPRSAAIVTAIVIGDRAGLDDEIERRLQEAGTYHVIAISGGNIAILAG